MIDSNWFQKKWGSEMDPVGIDVIYKRLADLEARVKVIEEENLETSNELYRMENSLDARIDILAEYCRIDTDV